ncbi:rhodopsin [Trichoplax sp. H2]|nr:rhodopsin [Trichoplax sp. H2]|eukprot:RDD41869.1 rhodopsin [Trichoplax sp. H2]
MNSTNANVSQRWSGLELHKYAVVCAIPVSFIAWIFNTLIAYLLITVKYFRKPTYRLILVSVISDTLSSITIFIGYNLITFSKINHHQGSLICKTFSLIAFSSFGVSIMNLSLISVNRYFVIARPLSPFYRKYKIQFLVVCELFICIASISSTSPVLVYGSTYSHSTSFCDFMIITPAVAVWEILLSFILYIIPVLIMAVIYIKLVKTHTNHIRPGCIASDRAEIEIMQKKRFTKVLISITLSTVLIGWPQFATLIGSAVTRKTAYQVSLESHALYVLISLGSGVTLSLFAVNPLILLKFDHHIRQEFVSLLKKCLCT